MLHRAQRERASSGEEYQSIRRGTILRNVCRVFGGFVATLFLLAPSALPQITTGTVTGRVVDTSELPRRKRGHVRGATVPLLEIPGSPPVRVPRGHLQHPERGANQCYKRDGYFRQSTGIALQNAEFKSDGSIASGRSLPKNAGFGAATMRSIQLEVRFGF